VNVRLFDAQIRVLHRQQEVAKVYHFAAVLHMKVIQWRLVRPLVWLVGYGLTFCGRHHPARGRHAPERRRRRTGVGHSKRSDYAKHFFLCCFSLEIHSKTVLDRKKLKKN
jgi:hypothetical protein